MTLTTGIIADDLTGGMLVAASLVGQGIPCDVVLDPAVVDEGPQPATVIAGRFRFLPRDEAVPWFRQALAALEGQGARHLFYKYCATFDSTDDGAIGPCADALLEATGAPQLGFCPAFPPRGVTVYQGHIFLRQQLLSQSDKRFDPITPMPDPDLVAVLQRQSAHPVGLVPHQILSEGAEATRTHLAALAEEGVRHVLFDAVDEADVATCAAVTETWRAMTGGDTLAEILPAMQVLARHAPPTATVPDGHTVVIAGSCAGATHGQLAAFEAHHPVLRVDLGRVAENLGEAVDEATSFASARLGDGPVAVSIAATPERVSEIQASLGVRAAQDLGEAFCGTVAARLMASGVRRVIVAGGETSGAVARACGAERLQVMPDPRIPGGIAVERSAAPMAYYFKAGKMGGESIFLDLLEIFEDRRS